MVQTLPPQNSSPLDLVQGEYLRWRFCYVTFTYTAYTGNMVFDVRLVH